VDLPSEVGLPILTERLELRAFEPADLEALHAVYWTVSVPPMPAALWPSTGQ
jgi:hypothetical protein